MSGQQAPAAAAGTSAQWTVRPDEERFAALLRWLFGSQDCSGSTKPGAPDRDAAQPDGSDPTGAFPGGRAR